MGQFANAIASSPEAMRKAYGLAPSIRGTALLDLLRTKKGTMLKQTPVLPKSFERLDRVFEFARGDVFLASLRKQTLPPKTSVERSVMSGITAIARGDQRRYSKIRANPNVVAGLGQELPPTVARARSDLASGFWAGRRQQQRLRDYFGFKK